MVWVTSLIACDPKKEVVSKFFCILFILRQLLQIKCHSVNDTKLLGNLDKQIIGTSGLHLCSFGNAVQILKLALENFYEHMDKEMYWPANKS